VLCYLNYVIHGTSHYVCIYINVVASDIILLLHLWHDLYTIIFESKHILYVASESAPPPLPPPDEKFWVCNYLGHFIYFILLGIIESVLNQVN